MKKKKDIVQKINGLIRQARVPAYIHKFGPKKYTSIQHVRCWLLKEKLKQSWQDFYDDLLVLFDIYSEDELPDISTLKKFVKRLPFWIKNLLTKISAGSEPAEFGAIDSTYLSRNNASEHYIKRIDRETPVKKPMKLSLYVSKRRILSFRLRAKARGDPKDVSFLLKHASVLATTNCLDKGYDANWIHEEFRSRGVYSIIPVRKGARRGRYRKEMINYFDYGQYWQRNASEYNNSSFKRRFGDYVRSVSFRAQHSEVAARVILHNLKAIFLEIFTAAGFKEGEILITNHCTQKQQQWHRRSCHFVPSPTPQTRTLYYV